MLGLLAGCSPSNSSLSGAGSQRADPGPLPPTAIPRVSPVASPAAGSTGGVSRNAEGPRLGVNVLSTLEMSLVYRALLDQYVDQVSHTQLIDAGAGALQKGVREEAPLPMFSLLPTARPPATGDQAKDWTAFSASYDAVTQKLPDWSERTHVDWLVLRSMLASLEDPHTYFSTPEEVLRRREAVYVGIGIRMSRPDPTKAPLVTEVFPNSPAAAAGLRGGDRIVAVDGADLQDKPLPEIVSLIRGRAGTDVVVRVSRRGQAPVPVRMRRTPVQISSVQLAVIEGEGMGYIRIRGFDEETPLQVAAFIRSANAQGIRGWLLDLRGNTGGSLPALRQVAGSFMDNRPIGYEIDRQRLRTPILSEGTPNLAGAPVVVLIDRDTGSGGEILAAALREYGIADLVGATTSGSVGVAVPLGLSDGSEIQVTVRRYLTPNGAEINRVGVSPTVEVPMTDADIEADSDPQLEKAGELLKAKMGG